jgi:hypothetical protein
MQSSSTQSIGADPCAADDPLALDVARQIPDEGRSTDLLPALFDRPDDLIDVPLPKLEARAASAAG